MCPVDREFSHSHGGLISSNQNADESARIRAALLLRRFERLLVIAVTFEVERVCSELDPLKKECTVQTQRAKEAVERITNSIEKGF